LIRVQDVIGKLSLSLQQLLVAKENILSHCCDLLPLSFSKKSKKKKSDIEYRLNCDFSSFYFIYSPIGSQNPSQNRKKHHPSLLKKSIAIRRRSERQKRRCLLLQFTLKTRPTMVVPVLRNLGILVPWLSRNAFLRQRSKEKPPLGGRSIVVFVISSALSSTPDDDNDFDDDEYEKRRRRKRRRRTTRRAETVRWVVHAKLLLPARSLIRVRGFPRKLSTMELRAVEAGSCSC
jgi:hypothetical protein